MQTGGVISGVEEAAARQGVTVLHAGTAANDKGELVTSGGRVLNVVATGATLAGARDRAYAAAALINFDGINYRKDIGQA